MGLLFVCTLFILECWVSKKSLEYHDYDNRTKGEGQWSVVLCYLFYHNSMCYDYIRPRTVASGTVLLCSIISKTSFHEYIESVLLFEVVCS